MIASWPQKYSDGAKLVKLCVSKGKAGSFSFFKYPAENFEIFWRDF